MLPASCKSLYTQVYGAVWNNFLRDKDAEGNEVIPPSMFVTYGVKHMKIWTLGRDTVSGCCISRTISTMCLLRASGQHGQGQ